MSNSETSTDRSTFLKIGGVTLRRLRDRKEVPMEILPGGALAALAPRDEPETCPILGDDVDAAFERLRGSMVAITRNAGAVLNGAVEIEQASDDLSFMADRQAAGLQQTSLALGQVMTSMRGTAEHVRSALDLAVATKTDAEQSAAILQEAVTTMGAIEASSCEIGAISGMIDEIAGCSRQAEVGRRLVGDAAGMLARIIDRMARFHQLIEDVAALADDQATGLHQVGVAVNNMDRAARQNAAMMDESTAASRSLVAEAEALTGLMREFRVGQARQVVLISAPVTRPPGMSGIVVPFRRPTSSPKGRGPDGRIGH